jgi:hypothetical protein
MTPQQAARDDSKKKPHFFEKDVDWGGSGRAEDPWVALSWEVGACYCDEPSRHHRLIA